ncbi:receptor-like protein Cf-9 homolog [Salvia miltiorrhiza]|uniref:receptor-like protein Cf-9 homolog n=1 Tax=Salvia miltiorrhiza TaxID=226208 RepID=UPI0025AC27CF|nr:receptor-like protein Cf-9 homolog [Salvia miltiorrhiza]
MPKYLSPEVLITQALISHDLNHDPDGGPIPPAIGNLSQLNYLGLQFNELSGEIPPSICNLRSLHVLLLWSNKLRGAIPQCLGNLNSSLVVLHLSANQITSLQSTFTKDCSLQSLDINGNKLKGTLPQTLVNCQALRGIDLGDNEIRGAFPFWMETLPQLRVLILRSNKLDGEMSAASETEHPFPRLQVLDISRNAFSGSLPDRYFKNFRVMIDAKENMTGDHNDLYHQFINLTFTLKGLNQTLQRLLVTFTTIDLSMNRFSGSIPPTIGNLNSLRYLNLSNNSLTGHMPSTLGSMSLLESLDLSSNRLGGEIPSELARLTFLAKFNLSMNNLVGRIPQSGQLSTFQNDSYMGNPGLCGAPLTKQCERIDGNSMVPNDDDEEYGFVDGFGWRCVVLGYACGFGVGIGIGYLVIRYARPKWLVEFFFGVGYKYKMKRRNRAAATPRRR